MPLSVYQVCDVVALFLVVPLLEIVPQPVCGAVLQHALQVLLFEVLFLSPDTQLVDCKCLAPLDKSVDHQSERASAMFLRPNNLLFHENRVLLPLLKRCCFVEVLHTFEDLAELFDTSFLQKQLTLNCIPDGTHNLVSVLLNHLLVTTS